MKWVLKSGYEGEDGGVGREGEKADKDGGVGREGEKADKSVNRFREKAKVRAK